VVADVDGRRCELDEVLAGQAGAVRFAFERDRLTLRPAAALTERGQRLANEGQLRPALGLFRQAALADPYAPQPHYQAGLALLYLQRPGEAGEALDTAEERAPGWFHARTARWLAGELERGSVPHEAFRIWHALDEGPLPPEGKLRLAEQWAVQAPGLAPLHLLHARALRTRGLTAAAETACRRGLGCAAEPAVRTRLLVELAALVRSGEEKGRLLREAVALNGDLVAAATAAVVLAFE
jgi:hypothetical protein